MMTALPLCPSMLATFVFVFLVFWGAGLLGLGGAMADANLDANLVEREISSSCAQDTAVEQEMQ